MHWIRLFTIGIVFVLLFYIFYRVLQRYGLSPQSITESPGLVEGFSFTLTPTPASELAQMQMSSPPGVVSTTSNYPLGQYAIKGSYNSACSGTLVTLPALKYVLSRGCRFLDFEVFLVNGTVVVSVSTDSAHLVNPSNVIHLDGNTGILATLATSGFSTPCPNPADPLFVQLRIKSNNNDIYRLVAMAIANNFANSNLLFNGPVTASTPMSELMGKIVLVIDKTVAPDYAKYPACDPGANDCYNLSKYVNIVAGSQTLRTYNYGHLLDMRTTPPSINDDGLTTTFVNQGLTEAIPQVKAGNSNNPDPTPFFLNYGVNTILYQYSRNDAGLSEIETVFSGVKFAVAPMARVINYLNNSPVTPPESNTLAELSSNIGYITGNGTGDGTGYTSANGTGDTSTSGSLFDEITGMGGNTSNSK